MTLLLDLDGTLTDSRPGIVRAIAYALHRLGEEPVDETLLGRYVGRPLHDWFAELLATDSAARIAEAIDTYREYYSDRGMYESEVYGGIPEALESLGARGVRMIIATSKPRASARRIAEHFGLDRHLAEVWGCEPDGRRSDKRQLLAHILAVEGLEARTTTMVGDRHHDVEGARANGIDCAGALWGYGPRAELEAAGCVRFLETPADLARLAG